jgi:hypothetical protein
MRSTRTGIVDSHTMLEAGQRCDLQPARMQNLHLALDGDRAEANLVRRM